jgi:hypothetical protein
MSSGNALAAATALLQDQQLQVIGGHAKRQSTAAVHINTHCIWGRCSSVEDQEQGADVIFWIFKTDVWHTGWQHGEASIVDARLAYCRSARTGAYVQLLLVTWTFCAALRCAVSCIFLQLLGLTG